jgi:prepilin-type processing-associated H-X9-DG protein
MQFTPIANPIPPSEFYSVYVSDKYPRCLIAETAFARKVDSEGKTQMTTQCAIWSLDDKGHFGRKSATIDGLLREVRWSNDPSKASIMIVPKSPNKPQWYSFDLATAKIEPIPAPAAFNAPQQSPPTLRIESTPSQTVAGSIKRLHRSIWIKSSAPSDQPVFLLSPRGDFASLNSTLDSVALLDQGVVTVRALASMPVEMFRNAKAAADRAQAMSQAKLAALAALMYSSDYEDKLPSPDQVSSGALEPYTKDSSILSSFTYTFAGGSTTALENPANTMLGYVSAAGGFAVAYADGHVKWMKELPK